MENIKTNRTIIKYLITPEQFENYVEIQQSGITNMMNVKYVSELTGLTKDECIYIMRNYETLSEDFSADEIAKCL